jgi:hypothetical protein
VARIEIDHLIGRELPRTIASPVDVSAAALGLDAAYHHAVAACPRLAAARRRDNGWQLAAVVFDQNNYDVVAHNLATLRDRLTRFTSLEGLASSCGWNRKKPPSTAIACSQPLAGEIRIVKV